MKDPFPIIAKLGGRRAVAKLLRYKSGYFAVYQWTLRKRISGKAVMALQSYCDEMGIKYQTSDFVIPVRKDPAENAQRVNERKDTL